MASALRIARWAVRIDGLIMLVLGLLIWTGSFAALVPVHMLLGLVLVLALWTVAYAGYLARVPTGLVALVAFWGLLLPALGLTQHGLLAGDLHWIVDVVHLAVGISAIGLGEGLGAAIERRGGVVAAS